ncbi:MAG: glycosyltransferase family 4 protein [Cecembia sp.]
MKNKPRIFAFHLLNDRSGSPKVLRQNIEGWVSANWDVHLYTSKNQDGFLSDLDGITYHHGWYRYKSNPWSRLIYYTFSQLLLLVKMVGKIKSNDLIYINTALPFGAAILGKIKGSKVIYHIHESSIRPKPLKWFLFKVVSWTAHDIINVSEYVRLSHSIQTTKNHLVYNAIDEAFLKDVLPKKRKNSYSHVLMVCSLKKYKGVLEFIELANDLKSLSFKLVLNASQKEIEDFLKEIVIPENLEVFSSQKHLHPFYQWADIIVNLSNPDEWIETFGLTIIEGMAYGLPAIVPPVGGILEVIEDKKTGLALDVRNFQLLKANLQSILSDNIKYAFYSKNSLNRLTVFKEKMMQDQIMQIISSTQF